jgi:hypothetical protein
MLYKAREVNLRAYDTRTLVNPRHLLADFHDVKGNAHKQIAFEFDGDRNRFVMAPEDTSCKPIDMLPYAVLCDHCLSETGTRPAHGDRLRVRLRRRVRRAGDVMWTRPRLLAPEADVYGVMCVNLANVRSNVYAISFKEMVVCKELSPGFLFVTTTSPDDGGIHWRASELEPLDEDEDAIEDTVSIAYRKNTPTSGATPR